MLAPHSPMLLEDARMRAARFTCITLGSLFVWVISVILPDNDPRRIYTVGSAQKKMDTLRNTVFQKRRVGV